MKTKASLLLTRAVTRVLPMLVSAMCLTLASFPTQAQFANLGIAADIPVCKEGGMAAGQCLDAIEAKALKLAKGRVVRKDAKLELILPGKRVTLNNNDNDGKDYINHTYLGYEPQLHQHIVYVVFHQGDQYWAYHDKTGAQTKLTGYPVLSPDSQHFATMSVDLIAAFNPNLVEIWQVAGGALSKAASFPGDKWGPDGIEWKSASELLVKKVCNGPDPAHQEVIEPCGTLTIGRGRGGWAALP